MIVGWWLRVYELVNLLMDGGELINRECYDYFSFIIGFEFYRKCLVCD